MKRNPLESGTRNLVFRGPFEQAAGGGFEAAKNSFLYQRLKAAGVDLVSEPVVIRFGNKAGAKFFCFKDPDGPFLELIEPYNG